MWISDIATFIVNPATATTSTLVNATADVAIPADVVPSAMLTNGENYKWEISLFNPDWSSYLAGVKSDVDITTTAGITNNQLRKITVSPNPVSNTLFISGQDVTTVEIYDVSGKTLLNLGAVNRVDVSQLATGMYFIKINNGKAIACIKN